MNNLLLQVFVKAEKEKSLVGIYSTLTNSNEFIVGLVQGIEAGVLVILSVGSDAQPTNVFMLKLKTIKYVETDTKYLKSLSKMLNNKLLRNSILEMKGTIVKRGIRKYFDSLIHKKELLSLVMGDSPVNYLSGYLIKYDKNYFRLKTINSFGELDGITIGQISKISELRFGFGEQAKLQLLNKLTL